MEEWDQRSKPTTSGEVLWERKQLAVTAYNGYEIYTGTLPVQVPAEVRETWMDG